MNTGVHIIFDLLIIFVAAKLLGELAERLQQPAVIGELIAGIIIGPGVLGWVTIDAAVSTVSTLGVVVLMFLVGLQTRPLDMLKVGKRACCVATLGVVASLAGGYWFGRLIGCDSMESLYIGTALTATSVGITARVLSDSGHLSSKLAHIILVSAVADDVLGMLVLAVVSSMNGGQVSLLGVAVPILEAIALIAFAMLVAPRLVRGKGRLLASFHTGNGAFIVIMAVMLAVATLSEMIGLSAIVGSFFAGMMFSETRRQSDLLEQVEPLAELLVPCFFVVSGMLVNPSVFLSASSLVPGIGLAFVAILTKLFGCGLASWGLGLRSMAAIGVGHIPRGEVALIVASAGLAQSAITSTTYALIIFALVISILVVPPALVRILPSSTVKRPETGVASAPAALPSDDTI